MLLTEKQEEEEAESTTRPKQENRVGVHEVNPTMDLSF
jgi:hypothetical protein